MTSEHPETAEQLTKYLNKIQNIYLAGENTLMPIAIDDNGRYYSASGKKGIIYNIEELVDCEERISSVANIFGTDSTDILFIYKLDKPISLGDTTVLYCGYIKGNTAQLPANAFSARLLASFSPYCINFA